MANEIIPSQDPVSPPVAVQPKLSLLKRLSANKTLFVSLCAGLVLLVSMAAYIFVSPAKKISPSPVIAVPTSTPSPTSAIPTKASAPTTVPIATKIPEKVVNWQTYTNSQYKYAIKYPPDWLVTNLGSLEPLIPNYIVFNPVTASASARSVTISVSTRTYAEQLTFGASSSAITVAGIAGTKQFFKDSDGNQSTAVILPRSSNLLVIRAKTKYLTIFNQMLTTVTLTN